MPLPALKIINIVITFMLSFSRGMYAYVCPWFPLLYHLKLGSDCSMHIQIK